MCGIVGYTGPREAGPILIEGLQRLEYRGYDSAGIALVDEDGELFVEKKAGKLANLQTGIADRSPPVAIGLAHTRSGCGDWRACPPSSRSEEHTSELQSHSDLVWRLMLEKKK